MGSLPKQIKKVIRLKIIVVLLLILTLNPMGSEFVTSINNQEFFTYHIRDILEHFMEDDRDFENFFIATGTYEQELDKGHEFFGIAQGRNLILVQMESVQNMMLNNFYFGQEITPVLNELIRSPGVIYFNNFYYQVGVGSTSDAEFATLNSMMGSMDSFTYQIYQNNYFRGLPWILREHGYGSYKFHGFHREFWNRAGMYQTLGFNRYFCSLDFENDNIYGIGGGNIVGVSDSAFFEQTADFMTQLTQPFHSFIMTLSCHHPFWLPEHLRGIEIRPEEAGIVGDYLNAVHYADKCIGEFLEHLRERDLYYNSMIVFYADHFGLSRADSRIEETVSRWLGRPYTFDMMLNVPLIFYIPGTDINATFENSGGQLDIMPTIAFLLGIETLDTIYLGQNLFTGNDSTVAIQVHMLKGSFIRGDIVFEISRDGIFRNSRAWNRRTGEELPICDEIERHSGRAGEIIELSEIYLQHDVLRLALEQGRSESEITELISGNQAELPEHFAAMYIESNDRQALADFFVSMRLDREKNVILMSDDIFTLLEKMEFEYSGRPQITRGIGTLDENMNRVFLDVRSRIVPALSSDDNYTKVGHLGYRRIMLAPRDEIVLSDELLEMLTTNNPAGIVLSRERWRTNMNLWQGSKIPVFIYDNNVADDVDVMPVTRQPWR